MNKQRKKAPLAVREMVVFAMLGALMFVSKIIMEWIPNIHLVGALVMAYTLVYRKRALWPIYIYVLLLGLYHGITPWWAGHLYVWAVLWAATMALPLNMPKKVAPIVYMVVCALHGFTFGIQWAPLQAAMYGLSFKATLAWIAAGFPFDITHGIGNFFAGILIIPIVNTLKKLEKQYHR